LISKGFIKGSFCSFLAVLVCTWFPHPAFAAHRWGDEDDFGATPTATPYVAITPAPGPKKVPHGSGEEDLGAKPTSGPTTLVNAAPAEYPKVIIGAGDQLNIRVYGEDALATDYQVDSTGIIKFPYVGRVKLSGLTPVEASDLLDNLMKKPKHTTITITKSNTFWVSVLGDVTSPGKFEIRGAPTLPSVLAQAGGPKPDANLDNALLVHGRSKTKVKLRQWLRDEGTADSIIYMYPGDSLMIYRADWPATVGDVLQGIGIVLGVFAIGFATDRAIK